MRSCVSGLRRTTHLPKKPFVSYLLVALNVLAYFYTSGANDPRFAALALWPVGAEFAPWQLLTHAFMHASVTHLAFNMLGLYSFGPQLERVFGPGRFLLLYLASLLVAALCQLLVLYLAGVNAPTVGASGAIYGLLLAFGLLFPKQKVLLIFPPIPMPAWLFVTLFGILALVLGVTDRTSGVAHFAHLGGMLGSGVLLLLWRKQLWPLRNSTSHS